MGIKGGGRRRGRGVGRRGEGEEKEKERKGERRKLLLTFLKSYMKNLTKY